MLVASDQLSSCRRVPPSPPRTSRASPGVRSGRRGGRSDPRAGGSTESAHVAVASRRTLAALLAPARTIRAGRCWGRVGEYRRDRRLAQVAPGSQVLRDGVAPSSSSCRGHPRGSARVGGLSQVLAHPHGSSRSSRGHGRVRCFPGPALSGQHVPGPTSRHAQGPCVVSNIARNSLILWDILCRRRRRDQRGGAVSYPRYRTLQTPEIPPSSRGRPTGAAFARGAEVPRVRSRADYDVVARGARLTRLLAGRERRCRPRRGHRAGSHESSQRGNSNRSSRRSLGRLAAARARRGGTRRARGGFGIAGSSGVISGV